MKTAQILIALAATVLCGNSLHAQWDPNSGDWGESDPRDLRVMTWNVGDSLTSTAFKTDTFGSWNGLVRIIASLQPDVLILQECGDNSGNGTGSGADSVSELEQTVELFFHGGPDPFRGGTVGSYVQLFTPSYDLPYVFVSGATDGFNRNVIVSRYPFTDLTGDGAVTINNFVLIPDAYQFGGNGGIRGQQWAEIDLPDDEYAGDVAVGNSHLKAGGSSSDENDRNRASRNIAYFIDHYFNGAGTGTSDPNGAVLVPTTGTLLGENTPVIWGGDLNDQPFGAFHPAERMTAAGVIGGSDGTDRDRSDAAFDSAFHPVTFDSSTQSSSKLDYICWQDSIASTRRSFVFRSSGSNMSVAKIPEPARSFPVSPLSISSISSDHRPVVVDFILPEAENCVGDLDGDGTIGFADLNAFTAAFQSGDSAGDLDGDGSVGFADLNLFTAAFQAGCP